MQIHSEKMRQFVKRFRRYVPYPKSLLVIVLKLPLPNEKGKHVFFGETSGP